MDCNGNIVGIVSMTFHLVFLPQFCYSVAEAVAEAKLPLVKCIFVEWKSRI